MTPPMDRLASVTRREQDGVIVAAVRGEVDVSNAAEVGGELTEISNQAHDLVIDLSGVDHLDSTGIRLLYELDLSRRRRGQSLVIVAPVGGAARQVLELTAFDTKATLAGEVDGAVATARHLGQRGPGA